MPIVKMREDQLAALRAHAQRTGTDPARALDELLGIAAPVDDPDRDGDGRGDALQAKTRAAMAAIERGALEEHTDREGAIEAAEQSAEENAKELPPAKRKSGKKNPLLAWASDAKDGDEPLDHHPSRPQRKGR